jgi:hypothetical protein
MVNLGTNLGTNSAWIVDYLTTLSFKLLTNSEREVGISMNGA